jgi:capsid protein
VTATATHRQRLEVIRQRTKNARSRRAHARQQLDAAHEAGDQDAQAVAQIAYDTADEDLQVAERLESQLLSSIAGLDGDGPVESIFDDPHTVETLQRLGRSTSFPVGTVDLGPLSSREQLVEQINTGAWGQPKLAAVGTDIVVPDSARLGTHYGTVPQPRRPLSLLDLIPTSPMDGASFGYLQEGGSFDGAAETAEGAVKPEGQITLTEAEVTAATIAVWQRMRRQQLADVPSLADTITSRLTYGCLRRLENQVLAGDGVGENILGILATSGIGDVPFAAAVALSDLALDGIVAALLSEHQPDAVAINPLDYGAMLKAREGANAGARLDSAGAFGAQPATLWGLPAVPSTALTQGEALVGAFGTCARLFIREPITVRVSDATDDDYLRNVLRALAEMRAGLAIWDVKGFVRVDLKA